MFVLRRDNSEKFRTVFEINEDTSGFLQSEGTSLFRTKEGNVYRDTKVTSQSLDGSAKAFAARDKDEPPIVAVHGKFDHVVDDLAVNTDFLNEDAVI